MYSFQALRGVWIDGDDKAMKACPERYGILAPCLEKLEAPGVAMRAAIGPTPLLKAAPNDSDWF